MKNFAIFFTFSVIFVNLIPAKSDIKPAKNESVKIVKILPNSTGFRTVSKGIKKELTGIQELSGRFSNTTAESKMTEEKIVSRLLGITRTRRDAEGNTNGFSEEILRMIESMVE